MNILKLNKNYWPVNGFFKDELYENLRKKRLAVKRYLKDANSCEINEFISRIQKNIRNYYNIQTRPEIKCVNKVNTFKKNDIIYEEYTATMKNERRTRFYSCYLSGIKPKRAVIGIHGTNEDAEYFPGILQRTPRQGHENAVAFLKPLIKAGFLVICPDLPFHGEDYPGTSFDDKKFGRNICEVDILSRLCGHSFMHETVHRIMGLIDVISSGVLGDIQRSGITGYSLGGKCAMVIAACDKRIKSVSNFMGLSTYEKFLKNKPERIQTSTYVLGPGFLSGIGDTWNISAAIYNRPLFITACKDDAYTDYEGVNDIREINDIIYDNGHKDVSCLWKDFEGPHKLNNQMSKQLVSWFEKSI